MHDLAAPPAEGEGGVADSWEEVAEALDAAGGGAPDPGRGRSPPDAGVRGHPRPAARRGGCGAGRCADGDGDTLRRRVPAGQPRADV